MSKIKKIGKAAAYTAAYFAELAAITYYGIKLNERREDGDISTLRYAVEGTAVTLGAMALAWPICENGIEAISDVVDDCEKGVRNSYFELKNEHE